MNYSPLEGLSCRPSWGHFGVFLRPLEAILRPSRDHLDALWSCHHTFIPWYHIITPSYRHIKTTFLSPHLLYPHTSLSPYPPMPLSPYPLFTFPPADVSAWEKGGECLSQHCHVTRFLLLRTRVGKLIKLIDLSSWWNNIDPWLFMIIDAYDHAMMIWW